MNFGIRSAMLSCLSSMHGALWCTSKAKKDTTPELRLSRKLAELGQLGLSCVLASSRGQGLERSISVCEGTCSLMDFVGGPSGDWMCILLAGRLEKTIVRNPSSPPIVIGA